MISTANPLADIISIAGGGCIVMGVLVGYRDCGRRIAVVECPGCQYIITTLG